MGTVCGMAEVIYVDVDDTLVRSVGTKRIPMPGVIAAVRRLHGEGAQLYLWSPGGEEYARASATEVGLLACFVGFLPKPQTYIDDQAVHEWRGCRHVLPANV
jgi:cation transport ATPase